MSALSVFTHLFPPPKYISLPSVGMDISDTSLKYIQFERKHTRDTNLRLKYWGDVDITEGIVERGNVHDVEGLTKALQEVKNITGAEYVRVSLPEERAYLFETTIKNGTPFKEIRGLLEFKLEENVPLSPRDAYFDYEIVDTGGDEDAMRVVVAVYAKSTINNYFDACRKAHLVPLSFEIEAQAIARSAVSTTFHGTNMIIDFGKNRTGVGIVHKGTLMYTSTVDIGGRELSATLRSKLGDISESECTKIKNTQGLIHTEENAVVYKALAEKIEAIKEEIETRIHYWHTREADKGSRDIEKIILCGGSSNLAGLPEYFSNALSIQTERAQVWRNAFSLESFVPPITQRYSFGYATAIGLALNDFVTPHYD